MYQLKQFINLIFWDLNLYLLDSINLQTLPKEMLPLTVWRECLMRLLSVLPFGASVYLRINREEGLKKQFPLKSVCPMFRVSTSPS